MNEIERDSVDDYRQEIIDPTRVAATSERLNRFMWKKIKKSKSYRI